MKYRVAAAMTSQPNLNPVDANKAPSPPALAAPKLLYIGSSSPHVCLVDVPPPIRNSQFVRRRAADDGVTPRRRRVIRRVATRVDRLRHRAGVEQHQRGPGKGRDRG